MGTIVRNIIPRKQAESSQTTQYTATNCKCVIDAFTVTNTSAARVTISINLVASGGSPGDSNLIVKAKSIAPNECYRVTELIGQSLEDGGFISTIASAATSLTISATGREIS